MSQQTQDSLAPGAPGMDARWAPGPKNGVGTALSEESNVWFTIGHGILNEVYYPNADTPAIRDLGLLVADGHDYFSEEQAAVDSKVTWLERGVPAYRLRNASRDGRYFIEKQIVSDPKRPAVLQHVTFQSQSGTASDYHLYALLAPHLGDMGGNNTAWVDTSGDRPVLLAERDGCVLALMCSAPLMQYSAGFVGVSDGWQDISQHKQMTWHYSRAEGGNTALTAEIDLAQAAEGFTLALGFGTTADEATAAATASLSRPFHDTQREYIEGWQKWLGTVPGTSDEPDLAAISLAVLRSHVSKRPDGGIVAGLANPWGYAQGDGDKIGYHAVWTRDMVEAAGGLLAAGARKQVLPALEFLESTQQADGHWPQNMWLDGTPYWNGVQMDETALPIMLVGLAQRESAIDVNAALRFWPMVRRAAGFLLRNGPVTQQDRWEEDPGYTPFTVAAEIAALLVAADLADMQHEPAAAQHLRETADSWYDSIDSWMYASGTDWCTQYGVDGYYERIAPVGTQAVTRNQTTVHVKNVPDGQADMQSAHLVSPDALALVRFGLRAANDPRITNTVKLIDELLKIETPGGPVWHRYNDDGYGEHADGSPFDGTGIGRGWPLLTGERAHYELAAGRHDTAANLQATMEHFTGEGGLLPEQVWDSEPIPEHELELGRPSGSAMPLAWAHAEYLKLRRSLRDGSGKLFDQPPQTVQRYLVNKTTSPLRAWRFNHKLRTLPAGKTLRVETLAPATVHWSSDGWQTAHDTATRDTGLGVHYADIPASDLPADGQAQFTFYWHHADRWEGRDFSVQIAGA